MAGVKAHLAKARRNEKFLKEIRRLKGYPDWGVTTVFYIAVHYGRAFLAKQGYQITSHRHFQTVFERSTNDTVAFSHFRTLQTASEQSRYDATRCSWKQVETLSKNHLEPFKRALTRHGLT